MNIALLGSGRTGSFLHDVIAPNDQVTDFNSANKASAAKLAEFDVVICFCLVIFSMIILICLLNQVDQ